MTESEGGLTVLDGAKLRSLDLSLPESLAGPLTGATVLELAESKVSSTSLLGLALPENVRLSALNRLNIDDAEVFRRTEMEKEEAQSTLKTYLSAIAEELEDDPLVVAILDGKVLQLYMEDEDDFAMLAENIFTELDKEDTGKISKTEIENALVSMGVEMGVPPFSDFPQLHDILKKHGADSEGDVGQAQFAQILQPVLQELTESLAENHVVVIQNIKLCNGSKIRKILADEKRLNNLSERILHENGEKSLHTIRRFLEKTGREFGLPPLDIDSTDDNGILLYNVVFADVKKRHEDVVSGNEEFKVLLVAVLEKLVAQIEICPIFYELSGLPLLSVPY